MRFLSWKDVAKRRTTSVSTEKRRVKEDPRHPKPIQISPGRVAFIEAEVDAYDEIMVAELVARREEQSRPHEHGA